MISRRSYLAIAAVMLVVLFMFQFTNVALELWNDYEEKEHARDVSSLLVSSRRYIAPRSSSVRVSIWSEENASKLFTVLVERADTAAHTISEP